MPSQPAMNLTHHRGIPGEAALEYRVTAGLLATLLMAACDDLGQSRTNTPIVPCGTLDPDAQEAGDAVLPSIRYGDGVIRDCELALAPAVARSEADLSPMLAIGRFGAVRPAALASEGGASGPSEVTHGGDVLYLPPPAAGSEPGWARRDRSAEVYSSTDWERMGLFIVHGELNGDGVSDLFAVGDYAPVTRPGVARDIVAWSVDGAVARSGSVDADSVAAIIDMPQSDGAWLAQPAVLLGDVTGDGLSDIGLLLSVDLGPQTDQNFAVLPGPLNHDIALDQWDLWLGDVSTTTLGTPTVPSRFDANGDGINDVLAARPGAGSGQGTVCVFEGPIGASRAGDTCDVTLARGAGSTSAAGNGAGAFGDLTLNAGDIDGDGYADLLLGDSHWDTAYLEDVGAAWLHLGPFDTDRVLDYDAEATLVGSNEWEYMGGFAATGDLNGDGQHDLLMGAPYYVVYGEDGGPPLYESPDAGTRLFWGPLSGTRMFDEGMEIHARRSGPMLAEEDLDGDGVSDLIMSDAQANLDDRERREVEMGGAVHIWYSSASNVWPRPWAPSD